MVMKQNSSWANSIGCFIFFILLSFFTFYSNAYPAPSSYFDTVQKTYIGYYQRPGDPGGLIYWAERLDATGGNLTEIIEAFANSVESQTLYGTINSSNISTVVNGIYNALFGRDAEAGGLSYYVNGFNSGHFTAATIMLNVLYGAQNEDLQSIDNKLTVANLFTRTIDPELDGSNFQVTYAGNADAIAGRDFLTPVTSRSATIPTQGQITAYISNYIADPGDPLYSGTTIVGGTISSNTVWSGEVLVNSTVVVNPGVTLTIQPGTRVKFKHYRGYREPEKRLSLIVKGRIIAEGTLDQPIYFTSDALDPQNGDWSLVRLLAPEGQSRFRYSVFEFGQQGLSVWQGNVLISNSVFRWNNWEGIYLESYSHATIEYCQIYENGYNGLAGEQFNTITMDYCEVWRNGTNGVHVDATTLEIRRSRVHGNQANGLSIDDNGTLRALGVAIYNNQAWGIGFGEGTNTIEVSNLNLSGNGFGTIGGPYTEVPSSYYPPEQVNIGFEADQSHALGYIPGDPVFDGYLYVYPDDETRRIVRKIGQGLGLTWSVAWDGQYIWTAILQGIIYKLDPTTGTVLQQFTAPGPQPWGMTFDGEYLWLVDFAEKRISKINPANGQELATFPTPDPTGGCKGVAWDGMYLNVVGWTSPTIYRMDRQGNLIGTIQLEQGGVQGGGGIAWDGNHFWVPTGGAGKIIKYDTQGHAVGWIYPASEGTWDMAWDGQYLWATQRTNENWLDAKIYALEILKVYSP
jgi:hypothetical protein